MVCHHAREEKGSQEAKGLCSIEEKKKNVRTIHTPFCKCCSRIETSKRVGNKKE